MRTVGYSFTKHQSDFLTFCHTKASGHTVPNVPLAGLVIVPLLLVAAALAYWRMDNLTVAANDTRSFGLAMRAKHTWILAFLYIGTFGSFIGFAGAFPKIMSDSFPSHGLKLVFLGALVGSLTRPLGGIVADRFGGWRVTVLSLVVMAGAAIGAVSALQEKNFGLFMATFLLLFVFTGIGNGSIYRMIPAVFEATAADRSEAGLAMTKRVAAGAIGIVGAVGAFGGFLIPQGFAVSKAHSITAKAPHGSIVHALEVIVVVYLVMAVLTWAVYGRRGAALGQEGI